MDKAKAEAAMGKLSDFASDIVEGSLTEINLQIDSNFTANSCWDAILAIQVIG